MIRRKFLQSTGVSVSAVVALAGCSGQGTDEDGSDDTTTQPATDTPTPGDTPTPTSTPEPSFTSSVTWPPGGVKGQPMEFTIDVENTGDVVGDFDATLTAVDDELEQETVTVEPGERATITLTHVPGMSGTFDASVAGESTTLTVYDNELAFVHEMMAAVETIRIEKEISESGMIDLGEGPTNWAKDASTIVEKNFEADTFYKTEEADLTVADTELAETTEVWVVDGVRYEKKVKHTEGTTEFNKSISEKPHSGTVLDIHGVPTEEFLSFEHTSDEYVFVFDPQTSDEATALMNRVIGSGGFMPAEQATDASLEMRYDKRSGRATGYETEFTLEGADTFPELERTVTDDIVAYDEPVAVEVPDDVKNNAT